jgi:hypothetical protein
MNLTPGRLRYDLLADVSGPADPARFNRGSADRIVLEPRSTAQVYFYMANGVEIPEEHLKAGLVHLPTEADGKVVDMRAVTADLFEVHVCKGLKAPPHAYVAIQYRGYWYYIDDRDQASKSTLALMLQLSRLDFRGRQPGVEAPLLTLPVGR